MITTRSLLAAICLGLTTVFAPGLGAGLLAQDVAKLTNAKFVPILNGTASSDSRTITTYVTGDAIPNCPASNLYKHPVSESVHLERSGGYGSFWAPIVISMNPKLVTVYGSGTDESKNSFVKKIVRTAAVPSSGTTVEIRAIWGDVTKKVYWVLKPASVPFAYLKSIILPDGDPTAQSIANFQIQLIRKSGTGGTKVYWKMVPADAFRGVPNDVSYSSTGLNEMTIPAGEDIKRFKLEVLSRSSTSTAYIQTWVGNQNVSTCPEFFEKPFRIVVPVVRR